jgi:hypothetical protein
MQARRPFFILALGFSMWAAVAAGVSAKPKPCRMKDPDLSVFGIRLADAESAVRQVGSGWTLSEGEDDMPHVRFVSSNGAQELVLFSHYGAGEDEYGEIEVRKAGIEALVLKDLPTETFVSGRGVELGMSRADIISRFGSCLKADEKVGDGETIQYQIDNADRDPDLKGFNYPVYYAEYEFERGKLVRFRFGFEYP